MSFKALLTRVLAIAALSSDIALAATISIDFVGGSIVNGTPAPLSPADLAGVVPAMYWNSVANNAPVRNVGSLLDNNGAITSASLVWSSNNTWSNQITATDPDSRMMKGYLDNINTRGECEACERRASEIPEPQVALLIVCEHRDARAIG